MSALLATRGMGRGAEGSLAAFGFTRRSLVLQLTIDIISFTLAQCRLVEFTVEL